MSDTLVMNIRIKRILRSSFTSDEVLLLEDFFDSLVTFSGTPNEPADGDDVDVGQVDGSVGVESAEGKLDAWSIFGSNELVGVVAFTGEVDIGQLM